MCDVCAKETGKQVPYRAGGVYSPKNKEEENDEILGRTDIPRYCPVAGRLQWDVGE